MCGDQLPVLYRSSIGQVIGEVSVMYMSTTGRLSTVSRLIVDRYSTYSRPIVGRQSTDVSAEAKFLMDDEMGSVTSQNET